ncbi:hypothetical protein P4T43_14750 [Bacillus paranthracis]|uniref:DUF3168 domain-containing protein n=1 Tax=Bacillus paranthracis TaxID=2026186 RepID=A0AAX3QLP8_9BACI|nr:MULTISPECIES: hypothetical protein [Bacillus cereus group]MRA63534.1 hypothetical protein [Bacillus thuringiensis]OUB93104.1 hypothetical protein BK752_27365 [Bacillus thuringiensis serovar canadensis]MBE5114187.1 hypothetical protein [Bacillus paranthracis]MED0921584.1 hypothetical protein [Bacillus paranthracis]WES09726.1 hypothetical protein P3K65_27825 [Bacillus paranthracis]
MVNIRDTLTPFHIALVQRLKQHGVEASFDYNEDETGDIEFPFTTFEIPTIENNASKTTFGDKPLVVFYIVDEQPTNGRLYDIRAKIIQALEEDLILSNNLTCSNQKTDDSGVIRDPESGFRTVRLTYQFYIEGVK